MLTSGDVFANVRPGGYIPEEQIKDMDLDGIDVSILYPTLGLQLFKVPDSELLTAVFKTYNDWLGEFCHAAPKRLAGIAMINVDDVEVAVAELERCHKLGFIGGMITVYPPEDRRYDSPVYEPLWATAQDLGMPLGASCRDKPVWIRGGRPHRHQPVLRNGELRSLRPDVAYRHDVLRGVRALPAAANWGG